LKWRSSEKVALIRVDQDLDGRAFAVFDLEHHREAIATQLDPECASKWHHGALEWHESALKWRCNGTNQR